MKEYRQKEEDPHINMNTIPFGFTKAPKMPIGPVGDPSMGFDVEDSARQN